MDNTQYTPTVLSLCSGYGGIEIGLERAIGKINVLAHVEIEAYADANMVAKMETGQLVPAPLWTDLKTMRPEIFRNKVDILTGGYPCQPFSAAGQRKGKDDPRHLWPWIREIIKGVKPGLCFFENVEGHISLGLREVLTDLVKLGYRVENDCGEPTWGLFSAAEVGAPHQRKRVFILAYSECTIDRAKKWNQIIRKDSERSTSWTGRSGDKLEDTCNPGPRNNNRKIGCKTGAEILRQGNGQECSIRVESAGSDSELDDSRGKEPRWIPDKWGKEDFTVGIAGFNRWPSHPGQPQYEWEEPRVVDSKSSKRWRPCNQDNSRGRFEEIGRSNGTDGQDSTFKPKLGRTVNGPGSRVDRLRLLGNGVVPGQAKKAFRTLINRILYPQPNKAPAIQLELF